MKAVVALAVLVLVVLAIYCVVRAATTAYKYAVSNQKWRIHIEEAPDSTEVWLVKGKTVDFVGRARRTSPTYQDTFLELQGNAEEMMYERNAANRIARRLSK